MFQALKSRGGKNNVPALTVLPFLRARRQPIKQIKSGKG